MDSLFVENLILGFVVGAVVAWVYSLFKKR